MMNDEFSITGQLHTDMECLGGRTSEFNIDGAWSPLIDSRLGFPTVEGVRLLRKLQKIIDRHDQIITHSVPESQSVNSG